MPPPRLFENGGPTDCCTQHVMQIKTRHLKGENKWESSEKLDSNRLVIEGLKASQRNKLIVSGQNVAFSSKRRLIRMPATDK